MLYLRDAQPSEHDGQLSELDVKAKEITDTNKNRLTMFQILRNNKRVKIENLVLNRKSFVQSIENLFALSFLVKDGHVVIDVNEDGSHFVSPRNGPAARLVKFGEVKYNHFVFRMDFADWKLMKKVVPEGEELMPNRDIMTSLVFTEVNKLNRDLSTNSVFTETYKLVPVDDSRLRLCSTGVKKLSRNHSKILRKALDVDYSIEIGDANIDKGSLQRKLL